jgi:FAD/FMN-containing dehydrogenase
MMMLPATPDVIHSFVILAEAAPEELSTIANVMPAPPMPFVPAEHHGKLVILAMLCYAGAVEAGELAIAPFRALATPIVDMVKPSRYPEMYPPEDPDYHPIATGRTFFIDSVDRGVANTIVDHLNSTDAQMRVAQLRVLGGAMARVPVDATAFAHRRSKIIVNVAALYGSADQASVYEPWVTGFAAALQQSDAGRYVNFLVDEGEAAIRAAYPGATWDRLRAIKARYDPANLFRLNQNIPPATV